MVQIARCTRPDVPSPSCSPMSRCAQGTSVALAACRPRSSGLPDQDIQARPGRSPSQAGSVSKRLQLSRNSSSLVASLMLGGDRGGGFRPASVFATAAFPQFEGKTSIWLSVRVSQRSLGGRACPGISRSPQPRKPIWLSEAQSPSASGSRSKGVPEQNSARSLCRRPCRREARSARRRQDRESRGCRRERNLARKFAQAMKPQFARPGEIAATERHQSLVC